MHASSSEGISLQQLRDLGGLIKNVLTMPEVEIKDRDGKPQTWDIANLYVINSYFVEPLTWKELSMLIIHITGRLQHAYSMPINLMGRQKPINETKLGKFPPLLCLLSGKQPGIVAMDRFSPGGFPWTPLTSHGRTQTKTRTLLSWISHSEVASRPAKFLCPQSKRW